VRTLEVTLPDDVVAKAQRAAADRGVSVEELLRSSLVEKLERDAAFEAAATHVLSKNADLYERLS